MDLSRMPKLKNKYELCPDNIRVLFDKLIKESSRLCKTHKPTDTPDFRLINKGVFCLITIVPKLSVIRVNLKTEGLGLHLSSNEIHIIQKDRHAEGNERMEFEINKESQLTEAIRLIKEVSDRDQFINK